jgi:hypothetical protein
MAPPGHSFPFRPEEAEKWPLLKAGAVVEHPLRAKESCVVYFFVNGHGFSARPNSDNDRINLVTKDNAFRTEVRKVARARASA